MKKTEHPLRILLNPLFISLVSQTAFFFYVGEVPSPTQKKKAIWLARLTVHDDDPIPKVDKSNYRSKFSICLRVLPKYAGTNIISESNDDSTVKKDDY